MGHASPVNAIPKIPLSSIAKSFCRYRGRLPAALGKMSPDVLVKSSPGGFQDFARHLGAQARRSRIDLEVIEDGCRGQPC
jgi:hypothetical protein